MKDYKFVRKFNIRILRESLKETRICDSQYPRGENVWPPQSKFLTGGPAGSYLLNVGNCPMNFLKKTFHIAATCMIVQLLHL